ncbi:MAG: 2-oxoacid:acceptor oxidoreductase family protein [Candidatus Omnitrophota bacterium]
MKESIICAGFGGQGVMLLGKVLAQAALEEKKQLTWIPSYGSAMRGGTAFCMVVIADHEIASPYVDTCDTLFVFNQPSWAAFKARVKKGGLVILNSTLIHDQRPPATLQISPAPFTEIASALGDVRVANMVALGRYLKEKDILHRETVLRVFSAMAPKNKPHLLELNQKALEKGYNYSLV